MRRYFDRILFLLGYYAFWFSFFLISKVYFLIYQFSQSHSLSCNELLRIFGHGLRLDLSASGYIALFVTAIMILGISFAGRFIPVFISIFTKTLIVLISFLVVLDAGLYSFWGFRLDTTPLMYLKTPAAMMASITVGMLIKGFISWILLSGLAIYCFQRTIENSFRTQLDKGTWKEIPLLLVFAGCLVLPIRGGVGVAPLNTGSAYHSDRLFANHAAINVVWNAGFSLTEVNDHLKGYQFMTPEQAQEIFDKQHANLVSEPLDILNAKSPNILIIILESFTAKVIAPLGGLDSITPVFNQLCQEGILFTHFYANGDRSDKGLVSLLSGYPAQPTNSIIKFPKKTSSLPMLSVNFNQQGYNTSFYYGGDLDFANMRSYILNGKFDKIVTKDNFPKGFYNSKWGVHDHLVLDRLHHDLDSISQPFFNVCFTLSSHDPFDIPENPRFPGSDNVSQFLSSIAYTDRSLGEFMEKAKNSHWWHNTLVILVADHGVPIPGNSLVSDKEKFHIPMVWLGGAVSKKNLKLDNLVSQVDLPAILLDQLNIDHSSYTFSKKLSSRETAFVYYAFNNGFGWLSRENYLVHDCTANRTIISRGEDIQCELQKGKAYLQVLQTDLHTR
jgi:phosphoglycerol transferase MdoB-like AlkP superfamily enzyme